MNGKEYIKKLENVLEQVIKPLKSIPFKLVIKSLENVEVLEFDKNKKENKEVLDFLIKTAEKSKNNINKNGIKSNRVNEVGNKVEPFVKDALISENIEADTPKTKSGKKKSTGCPDLEFIYKGKWHYLECKTYNIKNIDTTQRSFYLSLCEKVIRDSFHFVISFEVIKEKNVYKVNNYKILSIENLDVDLKNEFNSDNKRLYSKENILFETKSRN